jgi:hypothetical protein
VKRHPLDSENWVKVFAESQKNKTECTAKQKANAAQSNQPLKRDVHDRRKEKAKRDNRSSLNNFNCHQPLLWSLRRGSGRQTIRIKIMRVIGQKLHGRADGKGQERRDQLEFNAESVRNITLFTHFSLFFPLFLTLTHTLLS